MLWNLLYNYLFDLVETSYGGHRATRKIFFRVIHAVLFEAGLIFTTIPIVAYWLDMSLLKAFVIDLSFVVFYLVYAFVYNYTFDKIYYKYFHEK